MVGKKALIAAAVVAVPLATYLLWPRHKEIKYEPFSPVEVNMSYQADAAFPDDQDRGHDELVLRDVKGNTKRLKGPSDAALWHAKFGNGFNYSIPEGHDDLLGTRIEPKFYRGSITDVRSRAYGNSERELFAEIEVDIATADGRSVTVVYRPDPATAKEIVPYLERNKHRPCIAPTDRYGIRGIVCSVK